MTDRPLWGKYRGVVSINLDPERRGRLRAKVKALGGLEVSWALPAAPFAWRSPTPRS